MEILLLIIGAAIGGVISWGITHKYAEKSSKENKELINELSQGIKESNTLKYFEVLLVSSKWKKEHINHREVWIAEDNNTFQIQSGDEGDEFHESWTEMYPDQNTRRYPVYLKIDNSIVKELDFISLDGGRIFVPMPDRTVEDGNVKYLWNLNSLEIKVCKVIGHYYIYKDLAGVARMSKVELVE